MNRREAITTLFGSAGAAFVPTALEAQRMDEEAKGVEDVGVLRVRPDDTLVIYTDGYPSPESCERMREQAKQALGVKAVMVVSGGARIGVVRTEP